MLTIRACSYLLILVASALCYFQCVESLNIALRVRTELRSKTVSNSLHDFDNHVDVNEGAIEFISELRESLARETFVRLSLLDNREILSPKNDDHEGRNGNINLEDLKSIVGRLVELKDGVKLQLQLRYRTNDKHLNYDIENSIEVLEPLVCKTFKRCSLITKSKTFTLKNWRIFKVVAQKKSSAALEKEAQNLLQHDRKKNVPVPVSAPFLQALKITTSEGRPKSGMSDKLRQVQRFVETLSNLVDKSNISIDAKKDSMKIVDMGCGMAYLTFAMHDHFIQKFENVNTVGVEARASLVSQTQKIANDLGYSGLNFVQSTIQEYTSSDQNPLDVLVALHACDTATDDAIYYGISKEASIIVVSPCCHKEARRQIDLTFSSKKRKVLGGRKNERKLKKTEEGFFDREDDDSDEADIEGEIEGSGRLDGPLGDLLRHNIFRERESEMVTDAIRALCLEMSGYDVSVIEFVGGEHTAKNVMLCAIRKKGNAKQSLNMLNKDKKDEEQGKDVVELRERVCSLMNTFGIKVLKLPSLLGISESVQEGTIRQLPIRGRRNKY